ncbi:hypothetical protein CLU79DRAFT_835309 [Phycomyces nitens]|nr:hypothetical protein CLU79DRAFT_835309 [Phycomyces nitens]
MNFLIIIIVFFFLFSSSPMSDKISIARLYIDRKIPRAIRVITLESGQPDNQVKETRNIWLYLFVAFNISIIIAFQVVMKQSNVQEPDSTRMFNIMEDIVF